MVVKNKLFYWLILAFIILLLCINISIFIQSGGYVALLPIAVQLIILIALLAKYKHSKILLKIWVVVFIIGASSLQLLGQLLQSFQNEIVINTFIWNSIDVLIGVFLLFLVNKNFQTESLEVETSDC